MAVRVKVTRLKLIARLEHVRDEAKKKHDKALAEWKVELRKAKRAAAADMRRKADVLESGDDIYLASSAYHPAGRREGTRVLEVESSVVIPARPQPHHGLLAVERAIALLDQSDDDKVSISTDDMRLYGVGSITELED